MTREEINDIFDFLEKELNKQGLFKFVLMDNETIYGLWKDTNKEFAYFYVNAIKKCIEEEASNER